MSETGEPHTPREITQHKVDMAVRDAWLAVTDISNMFKDPIAREFITKHESDISSLQTKAALILGAIDATRQPLKVVSHG